MRNIPASLSIIRLAWLSELTCTVFAVNAKPFGTTMASYTADQVQKFRQIFRERSTDEGLSLEGFQPAVEACLRSAGLPEPPSNYLSSEFRRLSTTGTVSWQQFFQVLIHCNLNYEPGFGYREEAVSPTRFSPGPPLNQSQQQQSGPTTSRDGGGGGGGGLGQSSRSRVGFVDSPEVVNVVDYFAGDDTPVEPASSWGQTLRRRGASLGRVIGDFFGLTDQSQFGTAEQAGWAQVGPASAEETFSIGRRLSFRTAQAEEPPPEYPGPPSMTVATGGRSFDPTELSDSSEEDDNLFVAAPPDYQDVVGSEQPPLIPPQQSTVVTAEVHSSHHVPNSSGQQQFLTQSPPITQQQYPSPTRPSQQRVAVVTEGSIDFIYDPNDAWNYYLKFVKAERNLRQRRHHQGAFEFFGSVDAVESNANPATGEVGRRGSVRRDRLGSSSGADQPVELRRRKKRKKNTKLQRQSTLVRHKVESLPSFTPWFIIVMSILQVVALIVLISINGGVAPIRATPIRHTGNFPSLRSNSTNATERVTYFEAVNLWIGLPPKELITIGAKFTPCMRRDFEILARNTEFYGDNSDTRGCCKNRENVGEIIRTQDCSCFSGTVNCTVNEGNVSDIAYNFGSCPVGSANFHPCCVSITGLCLVTSEVECDARGGDFHPDRGSCLEVNCLEGICGFNGANVGSDSGTPYLPNANQFWRFFLSIFIHLGVIHIVLIMPVQLYIGFKIERTIGWLRTGLIYLIAGIGGNIVSGIFVPYGVNAGASGAVFGLIGVLFVELFQFWQIVDRAPLELAKLLGFVIFLLALGTLPFIDNMAHVGGLLFGVVGAIIFVPYITFGKLDAIRKRILLAVCGPLLFLLFLSSLLTFYLIPNPSFCPGCGYINCFPYTPEFCPEEYRNARTETFSL